MAVSEGADGDTGRPKLSESARYRGQAAGRSPCAPPCWARCDPTRPPVKGEARGTGRIGPRGLRRMPSCLRELVFWTSRGQSDYGGQRPEGKVGAPQGENRGIPLRPHSDGASLRQQLRQDNETERSQPRQVGGEAAG